MTTIRRSSLLFITLFWVLLSATTCRETGLTTDVVEEGELLDLDDLPEETLSLDHDNGHDATAINATEDRNITKAKEIKVRSNLESMSDGELQALCSERGFVFENEGGGALTHEDYVEAAKRCLSLEDEMNAIIAGNPDLAAELEEEIERMRLEKERLEQERDTLLAEKIELEEKLRVSGVDPRTILGAPVLKNTTSESQTVDEVLRQSFVLLFDRVGKDMQVVGGALRFLLRPAGGGLQLVWRYAAPTIEGGIKHLITVVKRLLGMEQLSLVRRTALLQVRTAVKLAAPVLAKGRDLAKATIRALNQQGSIRKAGLIVRAFVGPLCESLLSGWRVIKPDLVGATAKASTWFKRLKGESAVPDAAQKRRSGIRRSK